MSGACADTAIVLRRVLWESRHYDVVVINVDIDLSLVRNIQLSQGTRLELRLESFNVTNVTNLGLPVADLNSANFGRILSAGPPRLMQCGVKYVF